MVNNTYQQYFYEGISQLQLFYDQAILRLTQLEEENQRLKEELSLKESQTSSQNNFSLPFVLEVLREMKLEDSYSLFLKLLSQKIGPEILVDFVLFLKQLFDNHDYFKLESGIDSFVAAVNRFSTIPQSVINDLLQLLKKMFIFEYDDLDDMDLCYRSALQAIVDIKQPECKNRIKFFLTQEFDLTAAYFLNSNHPELILDYMHGLLHYGLEKELSTIYKHMVVPEWPFLDANVDKKRFYRFLWYGVLQGIDDKLVEYSKESLIFLSNTKDPEIELYTLIYDIRNRAQPVTYEELSKIEKLLASEMSLRKLEKEAVASKLQQELKMELDIAITSKINDRPQRSVVDEVIQIKKHTKECPHCDHVQLLDEEVEVNVYQKNEINGRITHKVLRCSKCQRVYMFGGEIPKLKQKAGSRTVKTKLDPIQYRPNEKKIVVIKPVNQPVASVPFVWPSTAAEETSSPGSSECQFKEESNLHRLGYRITGLNRIQRWDILVRKAIPTLSLKEIVYTIANNVKIRKRQVGGKNKFAYAIAEWEHDLKRLKQEYYKSNFTWPQY